MARFGSAGDDETVYGQAKPGRANLTCLSQKKIKWRTVWLAGVSVRPEAMKEATPWMISFISPLTRRHLTHRQT
jgi:hypothetical protein